MNKSHKSDRLINALPSQRYRDYAIRVGKYIGFFEEMYRQSSEIPWHKTVNAIFSDITTTILKHYRPHSLLDIGCGLGYMTKRLQLEIPDLKRVVGFDISETAIMRARDMFVDIDFFSGILDEWNLKERFEVVVSKDVIWYVINDLPQYFKRLTHFSSRFIYIGLSFPEHRPFYGESIFSNADALIHWVRNQGYCIVWKAVESDSEYNDREYVHLLIEVNK